MRESETEGLVNWVRLRLGLNDHLARLLINFSFEFCEVKVRLLRYDNWTSFEAEGEEELALLRVLVRHLVRDCARFLSCLKRAAYWVGLTVNGVNLVDFGGLRPNGSYRMSQFNRRFPEVFCQFSKFILFFLDLFAKRLLDFRRLPQTIEFGLGLHG